MKLGFQEALKSNSEIIIKFDADAQHKPEDITTFINLLNENDYDLVKEIDFLIMNLYIKCKIRIIGNLITTSLKNYIR